MFNTPITFVIGAGCSREYGLPLGNGLRDQISAMLAEVRPERVRNYHDDDLIFISSSGDRDVEFNTAIIQAAGPTQWQAGFSTCQAMAAGLSHASSIDRYLDHHSEDAAVVQFGKMAIARQILRAEAASSLALTDGGGLNMAGISEGNGNEPHWLNELFLRLQEGVRRGNIDQFLSNVTFVCFNYDRVIEHYLFHALMAFGRLTTEETANAMRGLKIYHPYGRLGRLPWEKGGDTAVDFGAEVHDPEPIVAMGENLRIFTETVEENDEILCIREAMLNANKIVFLGFSFLQQNLDLIRPVTRSHASEVWATTFRMSAYDVQAARKAVSKALIGSDPIGHEEAFDVSVDGGTAGHFLADAGNLLRS